MAATTTINIYCKYEDKDFSPDTFFMYRQCHDRVQ